MRPWLAGSKGPGDRGPRSPPVSDRRRRTKGRPLLLPGYRELLRVSPTPGAPPAPSCSGRGQHALSGTWPRGTWSGGQRQASGWSCELKGQSWNRDDLLPAQIPRPQPAARPGLLRPQTRGSADRGLVSYGLGLPLGLTPDSRCWVSSGLLGSPRSTRRWGLSGR